ncbi:hypothetical protein HEK616_36990 [Streptomyces nigrescens]|uniref:Uncharacterized protein n=1 Tax=Streptomyces nigrescens TaxID=1920 RepID=A0ABN6QXQ6_STRNI|nr:hypothetical protein HEK616_36990 [Streptomyces nigrescens]
MGPTKVVPRAVPGRLVVSVTRRGCGPGPETKLPTPLPNGIGEALTALPDGGAGQVAHGRGEPGRATAVVGPVASRPGRGTAMSRLLTVLSPSPPTSLELSPLAKLGATAGLRLLDATAVGHWDALVAPHGKTRGPLPLAGP